MKNNIVEVSRRCLTTFHINLSEDRLSSLIQFIKFGIVGVSNTLLSYLINIAVLLLLRNRNISWDYIAGNVISFIISVAWSFFWNNKYVFKTRSHESWISKLFKSYLAYGFTGIILSNILSYVWINLFHISKYIAPIINLVISVPVNFLIHKLWVYK